MKSIEELKQTPEYWDEKIKTDVYNLVVDFLSDEEFSEAIVEKLTGTGSVEISKVFMGGDMKISTFVKMCVMCGKAPVIEYRDLRPEETSMKLKLYKAIWKYMDEQNWTGSCLEEYAGISSESSEAIIQGEDAPISDVMAACIACGIDFELK